MGIKVWRHVGFFHPQFDESKATLGKNLKVGEFTTGWAVSCQGPLVEFAGRLKVDEQGKGIS